MVTWDTSWNFTLKYSQPTPTKNPKALIIRITVKDYYTGKTYEIRNGEKKDVYSDKVLVTAYVKNTGDAKGTIYAQLLVNGIPKGLKSASLDVGVSTAFSWDVELPNVSNTIVVEAGH